MRFGSASLGLRRSFPAKAIDSNSDSNRSERTAFVTSSLSPPPPYRAIVFISLLLLFSFSSLISPPPLPLLCRFSCSYYFLFLFLLLFSTQLLVFFTSSSTLLIFHQLFLFLRYYWFGPQDYYDTSVPVRHRSTPRSAARLFVQYYPPNVNMRPELEPYQGAER